MNDPVLVMIEWEDACHGTDERHHDEVGDLIKLVEVGILYKETSESVTISVEVESGVNDSVYVRNWITIPKKNIVWGARVPLQKFRDWIQANGSPLLRRASRSRQDKRRITPDSPLPG